MTSDRRIFYRWLAARKGINLLCYCGRPVTGVFKLPGEDFWVSSCRKCLVKFMEKHGIDSQQLTFKNCQHGKCGALATRIVVEKSSTVMSLTLCEYHRLLFKERVSVSIVYSEGTILPAVKREELVEGERVQCGSFMLMRSYLRKLEKELLEREMVGEVIA